MTRATKAKREQREQPAPTAARSVSRGLVWAAVVGVTGVIVLGVVVWRLADGGQALSLADPGPVHVHGLGVNPADGALFVATHTGLYRVGEGESKAARVGDSSQDTMGFTVIGPDRFLGSGHPSLSEMGEKKLPPLLGLIESADAGNSWQPISLLGKADFHVLRSSGEHVYGYDSSNDRLLVSTNRGRRWEQLEKPGSLVDLAVDPGDSEHLVVSSVGDRGDGLYESRDGAGSWQQLSETVGLLAWPARDQLYLVAGDGQALVSSDDGHTLEQLGKIGGQPAAFLAQGANQLYVALHDGTIKQSADGGATWTVRSTP